MGVPYEYMSMGVPYVYGLVCTYGAEHKYCMCIYTCVLLSEKPMCVWFTPHMSHTCIV